MSGWFESLTGLVLLDPWLLSLALLVPLALWGRSRRGPPSILFAPQRFVQPESGAARSWRLRLRTLPRLLQVVSLILVTLALARPAKLVRLPQRTEGIDIILCLDLSSSMVAMDMDVERTRLQLAREAAGRFIKGRSQDRIGLVGFARFPDLLCPLTRDHQALLEYLTAIHPVERDGPEDATGIGTAVTRSAQLLRSSLATSKVVILFTDGEENVATADTPEEIAPLHAAQLCEDDGIRVYAVAAGTRERRPTGEIVELDTRQIAGLATRTGGQFFEARDAEALGGVFEAIDALETVELSDPRYEVKESFLPFLVVALSLLVAGRLLESTVLEVLP